MLRNIVEKEENENDSDNLMRKQKEFFEETYVDIKALYEDIKNTSGINEIIKRTDIKLEDIKKLEKTLKILKMKRKEYFPLPIVQRKRFRIKVVISLWTR